ncbi:hypothetical protein ACFL6K_03860 [Candidatus Latescibacterota bacterium]
MKKDIHINLDELKCETECPQNLKCLDSGFENLCKCRDIGVEDFLECLEPKETLCDFKMAFGNGYICKCKIRLFIKKNYQK